MLKKFILIKIFLKIQKLFKNVQLSQFEEFYTYNFIYNFTLKNILKKIENIKILKSKIS